MDSLIYDVSELPGTYDYDGFPKNMRLKNGEKIKSKVPLQHIAYNIILPKVCKEIHPQNFRKFLKNYVPSVRTNENEKSAEYINRGDSQNHDKEDFGKSIQISIKNICVDPLLIAKYLCAEAGHAMSMDIFDVPENTDIREYYDYLAQKIGEDIFSNTIFSFKVESEIASTMHVFERLVEKRDENIYCIKKMEKQLKKTSENTTPGSIKKLKEFYEDCEFAKINLEKVLKICENDCSETHARGYSMAEIMYKNFEKDAFMHHIDLFTTRDRKIVLRPYVERTLPNEDRDILREVDKKINYIQKSVNRGYPKVHENQMNIVKEFLENVGIEIGKPYSMN